MDIRRITWPPLTDTAFALLVALAWIALYNQRFWAQVFSTMGFSGMSSLPFYLALLLVLVFTHAMLLLLMPGRTAMRAVASLLFVVAALCAYFTDAYGTAFDREMVRNVFETDHAEALDLFTWPLALRGLLAGIGPAVLLWYIPLRRRGWRIAVVRRAAFAALGVAACTLAALGASSGLAVFLREHKPVRALLAPAAAVAGTLSYLEGATTPAVHRTDPGGTGWRVAPATGPLRTASTGRQPHRPLLLVVVVGETARAANFQLNGHARATTPRLAARDDLIYYPDTRACGTSTAVSVPCMFSHLPQSQFSRAQDGQYFNLLDMLQAAGITVRWLDNNSGCKTVCERVPTVSTAGLCAGQHCRDEVLAQELARLLPGVRSDTLVVLHQNGSHGPAYSERYPAQDEFFRPACHSSRLDHCSRDEVANAYDNTLRYTDAQLQALIGQLQAASGSLDSALMYVSDHGESLGENGIYLHGMPYRFAPQAQKQVPMLVWLSKGYLQRSQLALSCLRQRAALREASHDNVFHTVMGLLGVRNDVYAPEFDLTRGCDSRQVTLAASRYQFQRTPREGSNGRPRNVRRRNVLPSATRSVQHSLGCASAFCSSTL